MTQLSGKVISIDMCGQARDLRPNMLALSLTEQKVAPLQKLLLQADGGELTFDMVVDIIHIAFQANKDTRFTRDQIAEYVWEKSHLNYIQWLAEWLVAILGGEFKESNDSLSEEDKKKSQ